VRADADGSLRVIVHLLASDGSAQLTASDRLHGYLSDGALVASLVGLATPDGDGPIEMLEVFAVEIAPAAIGRAADEYDAKQAITPAGGEQTEPSDQSTSASVAPERSESKGL